MAFNHLLNPLCTSAFEGKANCSLFSPMNYNSSRSFEMVAFKELLNCIICVGLRGQCRKLSSHGLHLIYADALSASDWEANCSKISKGYNCTTSFEIVTLILNQILYPKICVWLRSKLPSPLAVLNGPGYEVYQKWLIINTQFNLSIQTIIP